MRKLLLVLGMVLVLITGVAPICGGNDNDDYLDLIAKIRIFFNINEEEATDQELIGFLQDEGNETFIVATIKQIEFGETVLGPRGQSEPVETELLEYMAKRNVFMTLEYFLNQITDLPIATVVNNLLTIHSGYKIFEKLADALAEFNRRNIMYLYIHDRDNGQDKIQAFNSTINNPIFESVVDEILTLTEPSLVGKPKPEREVRLEELKKEFWDYCEYVYQSWDLANNREKKENIKRYILEWIGRHAPIPSPVFTPVPSPIPSPIPSSTPTPVPTPIITCPPEAEPKFTQGQEVITTDVLKVRVNPGLASQEIKIQPEGTSGKILEGPVCADDYTWWKVEYEDGTIGWSAEDWLEAREPQFRRSYLCDFSKPITLRETVKYGIFGDDAFDTVVCGYLKTKEVDVWEDQYIWVYLVIVDFLDEGFIRSIEEGIRIGNGVNSKSNGYYEFNLGCFLDGEIVSISKIDTQTQRVLLDSSPEKLVSITISFEEHPGTGCECCNLVEEIRLYE